MSADVEDEDAAAEADAEVDAAVPGRAGVPCGLNVPAPVAPEEAAAEAAAWSPAGVPGVGGADRLSHLADAVGVVGAAPLPPSTTLAGAGPLCMPNSVMTNPSSVMVPLALMRILLLPAAVVGLRL